MLRRIAASAALFLALIAPAFTPAGAVVTTSSLVVKDATGTSKSLGTVICRTLVHCYEHANIDTLGAMIDPSTKQLQQSILSALGSPFQAGGSIGNTAFGATQSGTWNVTNISGTISLPTGAATSSAQSTAQTSLTALQVALPTASAAVNVSTATTTQIIAASGSLVIHVKHWGLVTTLADNVTWKSADTGGSCANPVALTGAMPFGANGGASMGSGFGDVLILPSGKALCMTTSAATQISGSVSYSQF